LIKNKKIKIKTKNLKGVVVVVEKREIFRVSASFRMYILLRELAGGTGRGNHPYTNESNFVSSVKCHQKAGLHLEKPNEKKQTKIQRKISHSLSVRRCWR
jgi:hypothetical protein